VNRKPESLYFRTAGNHVLTAASARPGTASFIKPPVLYAETEQKLTKILATRKLFPVTNQITIYPFAAGYTIKRDKQYFQFNLAGQEVRPGSAPSYRPGIKNRIDPEEGIFTLPLLIIEPSNNYGWKDILHFVDPYSGDIILSWQYTGEHPGFFPGSCRVYDHRR